MFKNMNNFPIHFQTLFGNFLARAGEGEGAVASAPAKTDSVCKLRMAEESCVIGCMPGNGSKEGRANRSKQHNRSKHAARCSVAGGGSKATLR